MQGQSGSSIAGILTLDRKSSGFCSKVLIHALNGRVQEFFWWWWWYSCIKIPRNIPMPNVSVRKHCCSNNTKQQKPADIVNSRREFLSGSQHRPSLINASTSTTTACIRNIDQICRVEKAWIFPTSKGTKSKFHLHMTTSLVQIF